MKNTKQTKEDILKEFRKEWNDFYCYGWCDTSEDRKEFNKMEKRIKDFITEALTTQRDEMIEEIEKVEKLDDFHNGIHSIIIKREDYDNLMIKLNLIIKLKQND